VCVCVFFLIFPKCPVKPKSFPQKKKKKQKTNKQTPSTQNLNSPLVKIGPFSDHQKLIFHLILPAGPFDGASAQSPASDEAERLPTTNSAQQRGYGLFRCSSRAAHKLSTSSVIATFLRAAAAAPSLSLYCCCCCYYLAILRILCQLYLQLAAVAAVSYK